MDDAQERHDRIYGKRTLPAFDAHWVADRVKAGRNCLSAVDVRHLADEDGVTHVLDLREAHEWSPPWHGQDALDEIHERGLGRRNVPVEDGGSPTLRDLDEAVAFIDDSLADPSARVYVHCRAGFERTASVLVAWYARRHRVDYDTALGALRAARPSLEPLRHQEEVTRQWIAERVGTEPARQA